MMIRPAIENKINGMLRELRVKKIAEIIRKERKTASTALNQARDEIIPDNDPKLSALEKKIASLEKKIAAKSEPKRKPPNPKSKNPKNPPPKPSNNVKNDAKKTKKGTRTA